LRIRGQHLLPLALTNVSIQLTLFQEGWIRLHRSPIGAVPNPLRLGQRRGAGTEQEYQRESPDRFHLRLVKSNSPPMQCTRHSQYINGALCCHQPPTGTLAKTQHLLGVASHGGFHRLLGHGLRLVDGADHFHRGCCGLLLYDGALLRGCVTHYVEFICRHGWGYKCSQHNAAKSISNHGRFLMVRPT
jgi:hypothetical protein